MAISWNKQCACKEAYRVQRETTWANNTQSVNSEIKLWKYHALRHNGGPENINGAFLVDPNIPEGTELRALISFCFVKSVCALSSGMSENHPNRLSLSYQLELTSRSWWPQVLQQLARRSQSISTCTFVMQSGFPSSEIRHQNNKCSFDFWLVKLSNDWPPDRVIDTE